MNSKFNLLTGLALIFLVMISCSENDVIDLEPTLEEIVNNAEIIRGELPYYNGNIPDSKSNNTGSHIYISTPSRDGYLHFEVNSKAEKEAILELVANRFKKEFADYIDNNNSKGSSAREGCTDWKPISSDPNSPVSRTCTTALGFWGPILVEYCECGYCCD